MLPAAAFCADAVEAACRRLTFALESVQPPDSISPLQTFQAGGRTLFVDDQSFENKELLAALSPPDPLVKDLQKASQEQGSATPGGPSSLASGAGDQKRDAAAVDPASEASWRRL